MCVYLLSDSIGLSSQEQAVLSYFTECVYIYIMVTLLHFPKGFNISFSPRLLDSLIWMQ